MLIFYYFTFLTFWINQLFYQSSTLTIAYFPEERFKMFKLIVIIVNQPLFQCIYPAI